MVRATIGQVAAELQVTPQTLRNWEKRGLIPEPSRFGLGKRRFYTKRDIESIKRFAIDNSYLALA